MKKATAKKPQRSTKKPQQAIKTFHEQYFTDMFSFKTKPVHKDYLLQFALEWVDWAKNNDDALTLRQWYNVKGVLQTTVMDWMVKSPELKQAKDFVLQIIGARREVGMLNKKYSEGAVLKAMPMYDKEWKDLEEWRAGLAAKIQAAGNKPFDIIEVPRVEDCPDVPKRVE